MNMDTASFQPTGKTSLQSYLPALFPNQSMILVHNVHTHEEDMLFSKTKAANQVFWCLCPNANWYISRKMPPIDSLMKNDCRLVLGTDSLASNYRLNIMSEINRIQEHYPDIPLETMLTWATSNGAKALQLDELLGSFEIGKKPGIVLIKDGDAERIL
jgi:cytosine/adenosine deaminase-related metal-dependent hydrolase